MIYLKIRWATFGNAGSKLFTSPATCTPSRRRKITKRSMNRCFRRREFRLSFVLRGRLGEIGDCCDVAVVGRRMGSPPPLAALAPTPPEGASKQRSCFGRIVGKFVWRKATPSAFGSSLAREPGMEKIHGIGKVFSAARKPCFCALCFASRRPRRGRSAPAKPSQATLRAPAPREGAL